MKTERQDKILEIISRYDIDTQEELGERLRAAGFHVTQATISRDIRELKLTKVTGGDGGSHYAVRPEDPAVLCDRYTRVLQEALVSIAVGQNVLVIKTMPGTAMGVAAALDALQWKEILGSIAGDDTVMCVAGTAREAEETAGKLRTLLRNR